MAEGKQKEVKVQEGEPDIVLGEEVLTSVIKPLDFYVPNPVGLAGLRDTTGGALPAATWLDDGCLYGVDDKGYCVTLDEIRDKPYWRQGDKKGKRGKTCKYGVKQHTNKGGQKKGYCRSSPFHPLGKPRFNFGGDPMKQGCRWGQDAQGYCTSYLDLPEDYAQWVANRADTGCKYGARADGYCLSRPLPLPKNCKHGVKDNGRCKRKPGSKKSRRKKSGSRKRKSSGRRRKKSGSKKRSRRRSSRRRSGRRKSCKHGRKKSGGCKKKPGPKKSRRRRKSRRSRRSRRKSCKYGRKKSGGCKKKPGPKRRRRRSRK